MKRIALGLVAVASAFAFAAPASAHEICLPVVSYTDIPICIDSPVLS